MKSEIMFSEIFLYSTVLYSPFLCWKHAWPHRFSDFSDFFTSIQWHLCRMHCPIFMKLYKLFPHDSWTMTLCLEFWNFEIWPPGGSKNFEILAHFGVITLFTYNALSDLYKTLHTDSAWFMDNAPVFGN